MPLKDSNLHKVCADEETDVFEAHPKDALMRRNPLRSACDDARSMHAAKIAKDKGVAAFRFFRHSAAGPDAMRRSRPTNGSRGTSSPARRAAEPHPIHSRLRTDGGVAGRAVTHPSEGRDVSVL